MTHTTTSAHNDTTDSDLAEIRQAVANYCEGYYCRDPDQTFLAYHPECLKRAFEETEHGVFYLIMQTRASMVDVARIQERKIDNPTYEIIIDDVISDIASVRLYSDAWVDLLHVVKARDEWKLLHAAYDTRSESPVEAAQSEVDAIHAVALDYIEAWYQGDAQRHAHAYHDECVKRAFREDGGLEVTSGQRMVDLCATGNTILPDAEWDIHIDDIVGNVASVRVNSTRWIDHLHMAKARGRWALLHVSYAPRKSTAGPEPTRP